MRFPTIGDLIRVLDRHPWMADLLRALAGGAPPGECLVELLLAPHIPRVAQMTGLSEEQVSAVYRATAERIG